jgi:small basic protein (TIGR04137 family)
MHPSLKASEKGKKARSVLKRTERLKIMLDKEKWKEGDPVYGLPKYKTVRIKIKKEKAEKAVEAGAPEAAGKEGASAGAPAAGGKKEKKE